MNWQQLRYLYTLRTDIINNVTNIYHNYSDKTVHISLWERSDYGWTGGNAILTNIFSVNYSSIDLKRFNLSNNEVEYVPSGDMYFTIYVIQGKLYIISQDDLI